MMRFILTPPGVRWEIVEIVAVGVGVHPGVQATSAFLKASSTTRTVSFEAPLKWEDMPDLELVALLEAALADLS